MKTPLTLDEQLGNIRSACYDLQAAARLLETMMNAAPVSKVPVALQRFITDADWLSRQIFPLADKIATWSDDAWTLAVETRKGGAT